MQVKKAKIQKWKRINNKEEIVQYLLRWTQLHHNQAADSPALHPDYGIDGDLDRVPHDEKDYKMWMCELGNIKIRMEKLNKLYENFKHYINQMEEKNKT